MGIGYVRVNYGYVNGAKKGSARLLLIIFFFAIGSDSEERETVNGGVSLCELSREKSRVMRSLGWCPR